MIDVRDFDTRATVSFFQSMVRRSQADRLSDGVTAEARPEKISARLRLLRISQGLSKSEFADRNDIDRTYWSRFENGTRVINTDTALILRQNYGASLDWIIAGDWAKLPVELSLQLREAEEMLASTKSSID